MSLSRRDFLGRTAALALVAPTLPKLAHEAVGPGDRDATRWLQRKINRMGPGDRLRLGWRPLHISDTVHIRDKHNIEICDGHIVQDNPDCALILDADMGTTGLVLHDFILERGGVELA